MARNMQVPSGWRLVRLEDVAEVAFSPVDKKSIDGEIPVRLCNYTDVFYNRRIVPDMDFMAATATDAEYTKWSLHQGDVIFTKDSETPDEIGVPAYVSETLPDVLCGYHLALARPKDKFVDGAFLSEMLASRSSARQFARIANGVTRFGLTLNATRSLPILIPPLTEQRAIAAVLDSIDETIEHTEAVITATERLRESLLHELLTHGVPGWHTEWKEVRGIGTIPADWQVARLGDMATYVGSGVTPRGGRSAYQDSGVKFIRSQNVHFDGLKLDDVAYISTDTDEAMRRSRVLSGDVLLNITGASIGRCTVAPSELGRANVNQHVCIIRPHECANPNFISEWLGTPQSQREIDEVQIGQSRQGLNYQQVRALRIVRPSRHEQDEIAKLTISMRQSIQSYTEQLAKLEILRTSVADALLTGRLRVAV